MKKNNKVNPLTYFNNNKAAAIKKAGKEISTYKKSLKKAQYGIAAGPLERIESKKLDNLYGPNTPMVLSPETINNLVDTRNTVETNVRENKPYFNSGRWNSVENAIKEGRVKETELKKGGSVKRKKK
jgi:hypothetical protein